jgi:hypothetical protein
MNCWLCELVIALWFHVATICKCSINPISNTYPVYSRTPSRDNTKPLRDEDNELKTNMSTENSWVISVRGQRKRRLKCIYVWGSHSCGYGTFYLLYIKPCSLIKVDWHFGRTCRFHLQGRRISQASDKLVCFGTGSVTGWHKYQVI